jgi:hypothetical protein
VVSHPEQGWSLLCNGIVMFEDTGALLPDGRSIPPHQPAHLKVPAEQAGAVLPALEPGLDQGGVLGDVAFGQVGQGAFQV